MKRVVILLSDWAVYSYAQRTRKIKPWNRLRTKEKEEPVRINEGQLRDQVRISFVTCVKFRNLIKQQYVHLEVGLWNNTNFAQTRELYSCVGLRVIKKNGCLSSGQESCCLLSVHVTDGVRAIRWWWHYWLWNQACSSSPRDHMEWPTCSMGSLIIFPLLVSNF